MVIPRNTVHERFYVATAMDRAFASWDTIDEARACIRRFQQSAKAQIHKDAMKQLKSIIGIVKTTKEGRQLVEQLSH